MAHKWYQLHSIPGKSWWEAAQLLAWLSLRLGGSSLALSSAFLLFSSSVLAQLLWSVSRGLE